MIDTNDQTEDQTATPLDELSMLKQRARLMGLTFSNNISADKLRERIQAKMDGIKEAPVWPDTGLEPVANPLLGETVAPVKPLSIREQLLRDEMKLVRIRITNMDPKKKDLPGEIFTVANEYLGTVRKYIPFGEVTDDGYHVPYCLYRLLEARKFLNIRTRKLPNGQSKIESNWAKEFALEVLPALTQADLNRLATAQAAAGVFNENDSV